MWDPGFPSIASAPARLRGWHRRFCVYSEVYRGTKEKPGLVLGLDRGGSCRGLAFLVAPAQAAAALDYLWEREMSDGIYDLRMVPVELAPPNSAPVRVQACALTVRRSHPAYAGGLGLEETARLIHEGVGARGRCRDYLENTVRHLEALDLTDGTLHLVEGKVRELAVGTGTERHKFLKP